MQAQKIVSENPNQQSTQKIIYTDTRTDLRSFHDNSVSMKVTVVWYTVYVDKLHLKGKKLN